MVQRTVVEASDADGSYRSFGSSIDVDGDTMVIGAVNDHSAGPPDPPIYDGSAYVFVRTDERWVQQAKIVPDDIERNDRFGSGVAVSGDTIVIGSMWDDPQPERDRRSLRQAGRDRDHREEDEDERDAERRRDAVGHGVQRLHRHVGVDLRVV